jgi:hypothetical protein
MTCYRRRIADLERLLADALADGIRVSQDPSERHAFKHKLNVLNSDSSRPYFQERHEVDRVYEDFSSVHENQQQQQFLRGVSSVNQTKRVRPSGYAIGALSASDR